MKVLFTFDSPRLSPSEFSKPLPLLLLCYLKLSPKTVRSEIGAIFWPESKKQAQQNNLSECLRKLKLVSPDLIQKSPNTLTTTIGIDAEVLADAFYKGDYKKVISLYQRPFWAGLERDGRLHLGPELLEWLHDEREKYQAMVFESLLSLAEQNLKVSDFAQAADYAWQAFKLDTSISFPNPEDYLRLHRIFFLGNDPRAKEVKTFALDVYDDLLFDEQLDREPISQSQHLPSLTPTFLGRERELQELQDYLISGQRLISVCGLGGSGKTELAIGLAHNLTKNSAFEADIYFLALDQVASPPSEESVLEYISKVLKLSGRTLEQLTTFLKEQNPLLILDNFEHLLPYSYLISKLLAECTRQQILVTSREPLSLDGEQIYWLEGLEENNYDAATKLFLKLSRNQGVEFSESEHPVIQDICAYLAGLPLAIRLAAGWVSSMSLSAIKEWLQKDLSFLQSDESALERHSAFSNILEFSWQALDAESQAILSSLAIFEDHFDLEAASKVVGAKPTIIKSLVLKSLLRFDTSRKRYFFHTLVKQFLLSKMRLESVQAAYMQYFLSLLSQLGKEKRPPDLLNLLNKTPRDLFFAWQVACQQKAGDLLEQNILAMQRFCDETARNKEGLELLELAAKSMSESPNLQAQLKSSQVWLSFRMGNYLEVIKQAGKVQKLSGHSPESLSRCYIAFGASYDNLGYFEKARAFFVKDLAQHDDKSVMQANAYRNLAVIYRQLGKYKESNDAFKKAHTFYLSQNDEANLAWLDYNEAKNNLEQRLFMEARAQFFSVQQRAKVLGLNRLDLIASLGLAESKLIDLAPEVLIYCFDLEKQLETLSDNWLILDFNTLKGKSYMSLGESNQALACFLEALQQVQKLGSVPGILLRLGLIANTYLHLNDHTKASRLIHFLKQDKNYCRMSYVDQIFIDDLYNKKTGELLSSPATGSDHSLDQMCWQVVLEARTI